MPLHALLFAVWTLAYLFAYAFLGWIRTRNKRIFRKPVLVYGALLMPAGAALLALNPDLFRMAPMFVPMLLVNIRYAKRNRERSLINDLAAIIQFSLMVFVAYQTGGGGNWFLAAQLFLFSVLYFLGTAVYVKTIIREKHNPKYYWFSIGYHAALLAAAAFFYPLLLSVPLVVLLVRTIWSPRVKLTVKQFGMLEIAYSVIVTGFVLMTVLS